MHGRHRLALAGLALAALPVALLAALMHRTLTAVDVPEAGREVALSELTYKGSAFEAKVSAVRLELEEGADPVAGRWNFVGSNSDGQWHKIVLYVRPLDESGKQLDVFSEHCTLAAGARDQICKVPMKIKAETWKAVRRIQIGVDWMS